MKKTIIVANSVGIDSENYYIVHSPSRWSVGWKNYPQTFTYYPWELAYASSLLKKSAKDEVNVKFLDGCLNKWDNDRYFEEIKKYKPDYLLMESSSRTIDEDLKLMHRVKKEFNTILLLAGQHAIAFPDEMQKEVDFVLIGEYEFTVLDIIKGKKKEDIKGLYPNERRELINLDDLPFPEDEDVSRFDYTLSKEPTCDYLEIQMYASRGCPVRCNFCVCSNMYYHKPNWRKRSVQNIIDEIIYLKKKYPKMEGIFFDEEFHNADKNFILEFCSAIIKNRLNYLKIDAMCAYYTMDEEMLLAMKEAGYYKLRIGIETVSEKTAEGINLKGKFNIEKLLKILEFAKKIGIKMYGTFTIGAKFSTKEEDRKTAEFIKETFSNGLFDELQMSINTPQPGTPFYKYVEENDFIVEKNFKKYDGGNFSVVSYPNYSKKEIEETFLYALSKYDEGREMRLEKEFIENFLKFFEDKLLKKVLILRSDRFFHFNNLVKAIKKKDVNIEISVVGQEKVKKELEDNKNINKIFYYNEGFFNFDLFKEELKESIKKEKFDTLIFLYNNELKLGYEDIKKIAKNLNIAKIYGTFRNGEVENES